MFVLNAFPPVALPERGTAEPAEGQRQGLPLLGRLSKHSQGLVVRLLLAEAAGWQGCAAAEEPRTKASWSVCLAGALIQDCTF